MTKQIVTEDDMKRSQMMRLRGLRRHERTGGTGDYVGFSDTLPGAPRRPGEWRTSIVTRSRPVDLGAVDNAFFFLNDLPNK